MTIHEQLREQSRRMARGETVHDSENLGLALMQSDRPWLLGAYLVLGALDNGQPELAQEWLEDWLGELTPESLVFDPNKPTP